MASEEKNLHAGHRERVRERIREGGIDCLSDVEFLEYILFCSIPQGNTNPLAHKLINKFGSLERVFEATLDELMTVDGVGKKSADLISTYLPAFKRYTKKVSQPKGIYDTVEKVVQFFRNECMGNQVENSYALYLNQSKRKIKKVHFTKGTYNKTNIFIDQVVKEAITCNARYVIVAHNHTSGTVYPSEADCLTAISLDEALHTVKKDLLDFVVVDHLEAFSFQEKGLIDEYGISNPYSRPTFIGSENPLLRNGITIHDDDNF